MRPQLRHPPHGNVHGLHELQVCRSDLFASFTALHSTHSLPQVPLGGITVMETPPMAARASFRRVSQTAASVVSTALPFLAWPIPPALLPIVPLPVRFSSSRSCSSLCPGETDRADCDLLPSTGCEINLRIDNQHCGICGRVCHSSCSNSSCLTNCPPPSLSS